jgi:Family of unknown function (DUF6011)
MMPSAMMYSYENISKFVLAGNSTFTLVSKKTGVRFTYHVQQAKPNFDRPMASAPVFFLRLLNGPDNHNDYQYVGIIKHIDSYWVVKQTAKSKVDPGAPSYQAINWYLGKVLNRQNTDMVEFWHEGKCGRCGRKLTVPSSLEIGLGPECAGK